MMNLQQFASREKHSVNEDIEKCERSMRPIFARIAPEASFSREERPESVSLFWKFRREKSLGWTRSLEFSEILLIATLSEKELSALLEKKVRDALA